MGKRKIMPLIDFLKSQVLRKKREGFGNKEILKMINDLIGEDHQTSH